MDNENPVSKMKQGFTNAGAIEKELWLTYLR